MYDSAGRLHEGWWILIFFVLWKMVELIAGVVASFFPRPFLLSAWFTPYFFGVVLLATVLTMRLRKDPLASVGFHFDRRWAQEAVAGTLVGIVLMLVTAGWVWAGHGVTFHRTPGTQGLSLLMGLWTFTWVALFEETLFRGFVFQRLSSAFGAWIGQGLVAAWFAFAHWGNPGMHGATKLWASLNIGLASLLLGLAYLKTRSLALPIGIHLGWNWTQGNVLGFGVSGTQADPGWWTPTFGSRPEWFTGGAFGLEASLPCVVVCTAFIVALWCWKPNAVSGDPSTDGARPPAR